MATANLNRATQVLRIDLSPAEFAVLDALFSTQGPSLVEQAISYLVQQQKQETVVRQKGQLKDYVERARDAKRAELAAIMNADNQA